MPFFLMDRLNQTECVVFKLWMLYSQRISFQITYRSQQLSLFRVEAVKFLPIYRNIVVNFTCACPLGL